MAKADISNLEMKASSATRNLGVIADAAATTAAEAANKSAASELLVAVEATNTTCKISAHNASVELGAIADVAATTTAEAANKSAANKLLVAVEAANTTREISANNDSVELVVLLKMGIVEPFVQDVLDAEVIEQDLGITYNGRLWISVAVIKSDKGTRYALDSIITHDREKLPCWPLANLSSFRQKLGSEAYDKLEVIGIDQAQFFEDLYDFYREAADLDGKTVIVAGLDGGYLRRSFGSVLQVIQLADSVTKLNAWCELCCRQAFFTLRKTEETETELIAGAEVYMPVCRKHYVSGQVVKEAAKTMLEFQRVQCGAIVQLCTTS